MRLTFYRATDSLCIELTPGRGAETREAVEGLYVDIDSSGEVVGLDLDFASRRFELSRLETIAPPLKPAAA